MPEWPHVPPGHPEEDPIAGRQAPVVLMAASGGGSRAAIYTALTLQSLHRDFAPVALRLQAISSVSGGSLANAAYILVRRAAPPGNVDTDLAKMIEALRGDFLRPTIKGATVPGTSRGKAIEEHWEKAGVAGGTLSELISEWRSPGVAFPVFPIPLLNTSTLDSHDVVISPLEKAFYTRPDLPTDVELSEDATWVYDRDGIYGLEDLLPGFDPPLSSAVRASANFPFGFPLVRIQTKLPLHFSPLASERKGGTVKTVLLTDGGALSNSGMWPLWNLLTHRCLLDRLKQRGVLLVVVNASKMPTYPERQKKYGTLWSAIGDQDPIGQALHRQTLDLLETLYGERIAVLQVDLMPDLRHNVLTTWALSDGSFATLERSFDARWREKRVHLCTKWRALTGAFPEEEKCLAWMSAALQKTVGRLIDRERPPLD